MIPLKLQLKNFLSYGNEIQTIDLAAYPLICLSGKNGHGKSALLDAITWAIWGQARKTTATSKADAGLLRLGQTQMMVMLDFEFNNQQYRVRREFAVTYGKPYAALDFGLVDETDALIPLTDKTISLTQAKIEQTLNLTFESFTNSAFLRQGQANEFSKKSPKERKEILAAILGLNQYETIRKLALEKIRLASQEKASRSLLIEQLELELQKKEEVAHLLLNAQQALDQLSTQEKQITAQTAQLKLQQHSLSQHAATSQQLQFNYQQQCTKENELHEQLKQLQQHYKNIHGLQLRSSGAVQLEADKQQLITQIKNHQEKLARNLEIKEELLAQKELSQQRLYALQQKITLNNQQKKTAVDQLSLEKQIAHAQILNLEKKLLELDKEQKQYEKEVAILDASHAQLETVTQKYLIVEKQFEKRKEHYQKFIEQGRWLTQELESLEQKKLLAHDNNDPSCPLCEQNLSAARKRFLKQKFVDQEQTLKHRIARLTELVKKLKLILIEQHKEIELYKKNIENLTIAASQAVQHTKTIEKIKLSLQEISDQLIIQKTQHSLLEVNHVTAVQQLQTDAENNDKALLEDPEFAAIKKKIAALEKQVEATSYNQQEHQAISLQLTAVEKELALYSQIMQQAALQEQRKETIYQLCNQLKLIKTEKTKLTVACNEFANLPNQIIQCKQQEAVLQTQLVEYTSSKESLLQEKAILSTQQTTLLKREAEYKDQQKLIVGLDAIASDYQIVATATGKDGIQALLIEDAIPEIEHEANELLSRLTNNQAQIFIESLRDLKKGGTKETLDIKISDATGIRPYEMFSGGEAFRIDFALRIAISKLLARRAGTSLQTLIIDEGFGSQDEEGLGLIMDALYKIQDDFSKIIIVSHLNSMKDQFPVHFIIEKGPQGSMVNVVELG